MGEMILTTHVYSELIRWKRLLVYTDRNTWYVNYHEPGNVIYSSRGDTGTLVRYPATYEGFAQLIARIVRVDARLRGGDTASWCLEIPTGPEQENAAIVPWPSMSRKDIEWLD